LYKSINQALYPPQQLDLEESIDFKNIKVELSEFKILVKILVSGFIAGGVVVLAIETLDRSRAANLGEGLGMLNIIFICVYLFIWLFEFENG
jgi:hypothetical protein